MKCAGLTAMASSLPRSGDISKRTTRGGKGAPRLLALPLGALLVAVGWITAHAQQGTAPSDVPRDHWAREAVVEVLDRGIMGALDEGAFRGEHAASRYDLAVVASRLLRALEQQAQPLDAADIQGLRQLVDEVRADLVEYYHSREEILNVARATHEAVAVFDETLNLVLARLDGLQEEGKARERNLQARIDELAARLQALEEENRMLKEQLAQQSASPSP